MRQKMYRIVVTGRLSRGFAAGFDGATQRQDGSDTVLEGDYVDQSHLHGLLDRLRGLGVEVTNFSTFSPEAEQMSEPDRKSSDSRPESAIGRNE